MVLCISRVREAGVGELLVAVGGRERVRMESGCVRVFKIWMWAMVLLKMLGLLVCVYIVLKVGCRC